MFVFCLFGSLTEPLPRKLRFSFLALCFGLFASALCTLFFLALCFGLFASALFCLRPSSSQLCALSLCLLLGFGLALESLED